MERHRNSLNTILTGRLGNWLASACIAAGNSAAASAQKLGVDQRNGNRTNPAQQWPGRRWCSQRTGGNLTRNTETNSDGAYVFSALPRGSYNIMVTAKGFQKFTAKAVVLDVAQEARVDITLTVGAVTEEVIVTGESIAQVDTTIGGDRQHDHRESRVNELELNGRNFTSLVTLSAGVVDQTGTG